MASNLLKPQGKTGTEGIRPANYPKIVIFNNFLKILNFKKWPQTSWNLKGRQELKELDQENN